ncbi:MFS transporter [Streptomyces acidiscabies]|uniref:MFS transporter n=1 Tax=Streptomyces acidiscabies TaxID=42234 RepID=UPI00067AF656|nr:MFS transporter [Streptomyces acidiscabies]
MSTPVSRPSYRAVLQLPYALRTFGSALLARLSYGLVSLSVLLTTVDATGSYTTAGVVMAVFGGTMVVLTPLRATLVDRHGPRRALPPMVLLYVTFLCGFAFTAVSPGPSPLALGTLIALAGACAPPLGPTMRAVWSELAPGKGMLQRAYSLDGVAEELLFVVGPVLVGVLVGVASPVAGVVASAGVMVVGTWGFVRSPGVRGFGGAGADRGAEGERAGAGSGAEGERAESGLGAGGERVGAEGGAGEARVGAECGAGGGRSGSGAEGGRAGFGAGVEGERVGADRGVGEVLAGADCGAGGGRAGSGSGAGGESAGFDPGAEGDRAASSAGESSQAYAGGACRTSEGPSASPRALLVPLALTAATGLALSAADLLVTAFADQHGYAPGAAAWTLAALSVGSAVGGLLNGAVDWRTPARTRLPRLAATLGVLLIAAGASPDIVTLAALLALAGAFVTPVITTSYLVAEETTAPTARTRAGAWINTAVNAGSSAGAAGAGLLLARAPLGVCFAAAGAVALVAGAGGAWAERR